MSIAWNRNRFALALIAAAPATFRRGTARWLAAWVFAIVAATAPPERSEPADMVAIEHQRQTIYHSPQKPGFTSWVGAWTMPDGSLMVSFTQATGPVEGRPQAPKEVQQKLNWPPEGHPGYDMTGLDLRNVHLRSTDAGKTWTAGQCRRVQVVHERRHGRGPDGPGRRHDPPRCLGFLSALRPGVAEDRIPAAVQRRHEDLGQARGLARRRRILRLAETDPRAPRRPADRARRAWPTFPPNSRTRAEFSKLFEPLLLVSADNGKTWKGPIAASFPRSIAGAGDRGVRRGGTGQRRSAVRLPAHRSRKRRREVAGRAC